MKRRLLKVAALLVLGAIVNVAVAWGCFAQYWLSRTSTRGVLWVPADGGILSDDEVWLAHHVDPTWTTRRLVRVYRQWGAGIERTLFWEETFGEREKKYYVERFRVGWPMQSFTCHAIRHSSDVWPRDQVHGAIVIKRRFQTLPLLPYVPLWPGFAINTIFYAAILWLLFAVPGFIRKRRRIKRGLCPACAYPVGSSELCSECGAQVASQSIDPPGGAGG